MSAATPFFVGVGLVVFGFGVSVWGFLVKGRSRRRARCPRCWYSMVGTPARDDNRICPECGHAIEGTRRLYRTRRHWRVVCFGLTCVLGGLTLGTIAKTSGKPWHRSVPASILVFMVNVVVSMRSKQKAGADPWDGRTLEWAIPSPPPAYNFAEIPQVKVLDDFWHTKYGEIEAGTPVPVVTGGANGGEQDAGEGHNIHLPSPSILPLIAALGPCILATGFIYNDNPWLLPLIPVGAVVMLVGLYGWALEPATE